MSFLVGTLYILRGSNYQPVEIRKRYHDLSNLLAISEPKNLRCKNKSSMDVLCCELFRKGLPGRLKFWKPSLTKEFFFRRSFFYYFFFAIWPDWPFRNFRTSKSVDRRFWNYANFADQWTFSKKWWKLGRSLHSNFGASKSGNWRFGTTKNWPITWLWGSKIAKWWVGYLGLCKKTILERADFTLQLLMFVTEERGRVMFVIFFLSFFCQLLSPQFQARLGWARPDHESSDQPA